MKKQVTKMPTWVVTGMREGVMTTLHVGRYATPEEAKDACVRKYDGRFGWMGLVAEDATWLSRSERRAVGL